MGIALFPDEADAPLIVDADAVLAFSLASQPLQPVGWRDPKIGKAAGVVQHAQFSPGNGLYVGWQAGRYPAMPDFPGFLVPESRDHDGRV